MTFTQSFSGGRCIPLNRQPNWSGLAASGEPGAGLAMRLAPGSRSVSDRQR
jgi:hypothetical protein